MIALLIRRLLSCMTSGRKDHLRYDQCLLVAKTGQNHAQPACGQSALGSAGCLTPGQHVTRVTPTSVEGRHPRTPSEAKGTGVHDCGDGRL